MADTEPRRPNVLFIVADQWRGDCLGGAGHPLVRTPRLDSLAAEGVRFPLHHGQASPCGPSRASIHTGTYLHTHRSVFNGSPLDAGLTNLALEARSAGYVPHLYGYTDTTIDPRTTTDDDPRLLDYEGPLPGFEETLLLPEHRDAWYRWLEGRGHDISDRSRFLRPRDDVEVPPGRGASWAPPPFSADETETPFVVDTAIDHIEDLVDGGDPWFLHVSLYRPHPPFTVPEPYNDMFDPADVPEPIPPTDGGHPFLQMMSTWGLTDPPVDPLDLRQLRATYYGMLAEVDHQVGRLLDTLSALSVDEDTIVVFSSDHGEFLGDHGLMSKLGFHDQAYHIPLIVRYPALGGPRGRVVDEFTENVDIMPTILDLAGLAVPAQCQGRSLRPFLEGGDAEDWRTSTHWEFDFRVFASEAGIPLTSCNLAVHRDRSGKYIHFAGMPPIFYDMESDPHELHPFREHPEMARYAAELLDWRMRSDDETLARRLATPHGMITLGDPGHAET